MTRWLVTGAGGMLGTDMVAVLTSRGEPVTGMNRADLDVTDAAAVSDAIARCRPDVVVNCAAWTAVDDAEASEEQALAVNAGGAANLAAACAGLGARLVQVSTDYVFAGDAAGRMPRMTSRRRAPPTGAPSWPASGPCSTACPVGLCRQDGVAVRGARAELRRTMIKLEDQRPTVDVVDDQHGQPTWTVDVARQIIALVHSSGRAGHLPCHQRGQTTWFGLAREIFGLLGADPARVRPIPSSALSRPAPRPAYSVLGHSAWAGLAFRLSASGGRLCIAPFPELVAAQRASAPTR
jgi:dTDP-4-dehydrorhamnose reductase